MSVYFVEISLVQLNLFAYNIAECLNNIIALDRGEIPEIFGK